MWTEAWHIFTDPGHVLAEMGFILAELLLLTLPVKWLVKRHDRKHHPVVGYRDVEENCFVGGTESSQHVAGGPINITITPCTPTTMFAGRVERMLKQYAL